MSFKDRQYYRDENGGIPPVVFALPKLTNLTMALIGVNLLIFILQASLRSGEIEYWGWLTFNDAQAFTQPWRWVTYQYLHGGAGHFFFNMIGLYFFVPTLELLWGWRKALAFYTVGGVVAGITFGLISLIFFQGSGGVLVGASGSILAAMGAVALLSPNRQLILLIFPVPIRVAVALIGAFYLLSALADRNLSNAAHLGGLAFGFFAPWLAGPMLAKQVRQWQKQRGKSAVAREHAEQRQIDEILAKVSSQGMHSLSWAERRRLKQATERQRRRDAETARSRHG